MPEPVPVPAPRPSLGVTADGRLTVTIGDEFTTTIDRTAHNNARAWLVIHPERGFLRGFDNPDRANAYAAEHQAALISVRVEADHIARGETR